MSAQAAFREALDRADVFRLRALWRGLFPRHPQPADAEEAAVVLHQARTGAESVRMEARLYSHAWLSERGLQSALPDEMRPPAERISPRIVEAVGISVNSSSRRPDRVEEAKEIERVMADAAGALMLDGEKDPKRVSAAMWQARDAYINRRLRRMI